jgi:hypothetical protein
VGFPIHPADSITIDYIALSGPTVGKNSYSTTTSGFTQPAPGATVVAFVADTSWMVVNQAVFVGAGSAPGTTLPAGYYKVAAKTGPTSCVLTNYQAGVTQGTFVGASAKIGPSGQAAGAP